MDYLPNDRRERNPEETTNFLSRLLFLHTKDLFLKGYKNNLEEKDIYEVPSHLKAQFLANQLENLLTKNKKNTLIKILLKYIGWQYFFLGLVQLVLKTSLIIFRPLLMTQFTSHLIKREIYFGNLYGFLLIILILSEILYDQWYFMQLGTLMIKVRCGFTALFYRKLFKLSSCCKDVSGGQLVTLISKDVSNLELFVKEANNSWISVMQIMVLYACFIEQLGSTGFILLLLFSVLLPVQITLVRKTLKFKEDELTNTRKRLETFCEVLQNFSLIKLLSLEDFFKSKLDNSRQSEVNGTYLVVYVNLIIFLNGLIWTCGTFLPWIATFFILNHKAKSNMVLMIFEFYHTLHDLLLVKFPLSLSQIYQTRVSVKRIKNFLELEEVHPVWKTLDNKICLKNTQISINKEVIFPKVNLDLECEKGLITISGPSGSGKSTLIKTIIGDCISAKLSVTRNGSISYFSQKPWIFPGTIRQNIIFGQLFDPKKYNNVLEMCNLIDDLRLFEEKDLMILLDNGNNINNGLKIKITLARALYKKSNLYLLDDPFSGFEQHLQEKIFDACIRRYLQNKLVILVTHNRKFCTESQVNVCVEEGSISVERNKKIIQGVKKDEAVINQLKLLPEIPVHDIYRETKNHGKVPWRIYKIWLKLGGGTLWFSVIFLSLVLSPIIVKVLVNNTISWTIIQEKINEMKWKNIANTQEFNLQNSQRDFIAQYIFSLTILIATFFGSHVYFLNFGKQCSVLLFQKILKKVLMARTQAVQNFLQSNVLNRISIDLINIDENLPFLAQNGTKLVVPILSIVCYAIHVQKIVLPFLVIFILILQLLKKVYVQVGRNLKRIELSSRSPILNYFTTTWDGLITIRGQAAEEILQDEFEQKLDFYTSTSYLNLGINRSFSLTLGWICSIFYATLVSLFLIEKDPHVVAFIVLQAFSIINNITELYFNWYLLEINMTSMERVLELKNTEEENNIGYEDSYFPKTGQITFQSVSVIFPYFKQPVLKNVDFVIQPKEKVGILGKTGSGKSLLMLSLLRVVNYEGRILVNNIDIKNFSLDLLRRKISVIPQCPVLFKGTLKENLDPYNKHSKNQIWQILQIVNLKRHLWDLNVDIGEVPVLSLAPKIQLFYLAKVILENNKILFLDDFGSPCYPEIEEIFSSLMETIFAKYTIIIVSNNWKILQKCSRILILDQGRLTDALKH